MGDWRFTNQHMTCQLRSQKSQTECQEFGGMRVSTWFSPETRAPNSMWTSFSQRSMRSVTGTEYLLRDVMER